MSEIFSGNTITIENLGNSKAKLNKIGMSRQKTRSGKNKFNALNPTSSNYATSKFEDDITTISSSVTNTFPYVLWKFENLNQGDIVRYRSILLDSNCQVYLQIYNGTEWSTISASKLSYINGTSESSYAYTVSSEVTAVRFLLYSSNVIPTGEISTRYKNVIVTINNEDMSYEPYGAMPSPEFRSEIRNVGDNVNEFDSEDWYETLRAINSDSMQKETVDGIEYYKFKPHSISDCQYMLGQFKENTQYTLSFIGRKYNKAGNTATGLRIRYTDGTNTTAIITTPTEYKYVLVSDKNKTISYITIYYAYNEYALVRNIKLEKGARATGYSPYNLGNFTIKNENLINYLDWNKFIDSSNWGNSLSNGYKTFTITGLKPRTTYTLCREDNIGLNKNVYACFNNTNNNMNRFISHAIETDNRQYISATSTSDGVLYITTSSIEWLFKTLKNCWIVEGDKYIEPESQQICFPLKPGQKMYKESYLADDGVHHKRGRYYLKNANFMLSANYENNSVFQASAPNGLKFVDETSLCNIATYEYLESASIKMNKIYTFMINDKSYIRMATADKTLEEFLSMIEQTDAYIEHKLAEEIIEPYTAEQENVYMQLQNMELYDGINYISVEGEPYAEIEVAVTKLIEDYDSYISSNGRLIVPGSNINYLVDLSESDIPTMPEAVESSVRVAGRDGDVPLKTTYEPMSYSIVCYTEDNLSLLEKVEEEKKINKLLNSIKDKTMTFALEKSNKFYNVKYSGALTTINYPKHLKFSIPLKASDSYGKDLIKKSIVGNSIGESETAEKVGALFILRGPATNPIIALNDYSMEYGMAILEGARVEIDSNKSTITHINSSGIKTNVMKYYNHQFPKIENGINELKILSGFDSDMQVSVIWNDLKL